jgi:hypothetical protein
MSTASFDRSFDITDTESAQRLIKDLASPRSVKVTKRDYASENEKGIQILKQRLSAFQKQ